MQNTFGIKDFVIIVLILVLGLAVWLSMFQRDREWDQLQYIRGKVNEVETHLARVESRIESGVNVAQMPGTTGSNAGSPAGGEQGVAAVRDESWARPGVAVEWQPAYTFATDPRTQPGFKPGGSFTEALESRPPKIVPYISTDVVGRRAIDLVVETLAAYDPNTLKLRGVLADAWQMDPEGMWMRAKIRDNARFSDGQPVTAEDFRWTFHEYVMNQQIEAQRTRSIVSDQVDRVEVISEKVVEVHFKQRLFSNRDVGLTFWILPKHFYGNLTPAQINQGTGLLMGSGPFKMAELDVERQWAPGQVISLVRNEQYWGPKPAIEKLNFRDIQDELPRLTAFRNREVDMVTPAAPQFASLLQDKDFTSRNQLFNRVTMRAARGGIIWNCGERGSSGKLTPFHDKRVRQAMTLLLDREKMVRDIWHGIGEVCTGFMNPESPGYDPNLKPWPYNPAQGMKLLEEAGWKMGGKGVLQNEKGDEFVFEFTFFTAGETSQRIATFVQDAYNAAGIRVILRGVDWSVGDPIRKQRDFDAMIMSWGASAPESDPKQIFHSESIKDQGDNFGQWNSPAGDAAIDALRVEIDDEKRAKHWQAFERALYEEQPYTWIHLRPELRFLPNDVGNARMYPKGIEPWEFFRGPAALPASIN